jgi:hypothetical protein
MHTTDKLIYSGLFYKHTTIVNYASSIINKLEALLTDEPRVIIYTRHVFIVQATGLNAATLHTYSLHRFDLHENYFYVSEMIHLSGVESCYIQSECLSLSQYVYN